MKVRIDLLLVQKGLAPGRDRAKALIMEGGVFVDGQKTEKPGEEVEEAASIEIRGRTLPYVSRGGLKLEKAVKSFGLTLSGLTCMDIGASTGGFTDCMLQNGAAHVYAVDVGYGQLAWKLRQDPRVTVLERTNIRYITKEQVPEPLDLFSVDVSFISLTLVLPAAQPLLKEGGAAVCLIKPQFEAGRGRVGKKGVVREPEIHADVIRKICAFAVEHGFTVRGLDYSPVKGPEGNIEYLLYLGNGAGRSAGQDIEALVKRSHAELS